MRTILIIVMLFMAVPCWAEDVTCSKDNRESLCEMMSTQARMGIVICGIAVNWGLRGQEFAELGEYGPKLAETVEKICGRLPEPVAVEVQDFTEKRAMLLRQAARILGGADKKALEIYEQKGTLENSLSKLEDMEREVKKLILEIAK